ncbi:MAG: alpha-galactosidase, partial [Lachnospiraceae bacterium]|nr:alpha-galactosidase [Lachnospiraceae bacterium]
DLMTFHGKWARERETDRRPVSHGIQAVQSVRGASGAAYNPAAILCAPQTTEDHGEAWGLAFVYSGEFLLEAEKDALGQTRVILGIHPDDFTWTLQPGETFDSPEAVLTYSDAGLSALSHAFHDFTRQCIVRGYWKDRRRPVLLNNWEGTYFDFTGEKLIAMAQEAAALGIELFVLDDGWFGKRDDDRSGLGDWFPNEKKLGMTIGALGEKIRALGLRFGIWFEPEAVSEDSDLYRAHPDWAVTVPGRKPALSRCELILDFSRKDVQDYIIERMTAVIAESGASYLKWDFNRNVCDKYSHALPKEEQGTFAHRFVLGTYRVLRTLTETFPELLIEGCSGGGARFDLGMLCFTPQIWTSDDTDPIERLTIQYGTSFIYPVNTMGAHVSAVPNHQTGRVTPMETRKTTAMSGSFGYELDPAKLTAEEKERIRADIACFKDLYETVEYGDHYRLTDLSGRYVAWEEVRKDRKRALVNLVFTYAEANAPAPLVKLRGLDPDLRYRIRLVTRHGEENLGAKEREIFGGTLTLSGSALMNRGLYLPKQREDYQAWQVLLEA